MSELFLGKGHKVFGIEPNIKMRTAGEQSLAGENKFVSLDGRAEKVPLPDQCIDFVIAGQAFHWFDPHKSKVEVKRILRPDGDVALIWNEWDRRLSPLLEGYEDLLIKFGTDFAKVRRSTINETSIRKFFKPLQPRFAQFSNHQDFNFDALRGRLLSSSYAPLEDHPDFQAMIDNLQALYEEHKQKSIVRFDYRTTIYHAKMGK